MEVQRDDGPDTSAPVVEMDIVVDAERAPPSDVADNPNSREGISNQTCFNSVGHCRLLSGISFFHCASLSTQLNPYQTRILQ
jgi:hypothetical protein